MRLTAARSGTDPAGLRAVCRAKRCSARRPLPTAPRAATDAGPAEVQSAVEALWALRQDEGTSQEALDAALAAAEAAAAAAGVDRVVSPALNAGAFKGYTLQGKLRQDLAAGAVTLGRLSFGRYQPAGLLVQLEPEGAADLAVVTKGEWRARSSAYVVSTPFQVAPQDGEFAGFEGLQGMSHAVGEYAQSADDPRRLNISFAMLRLEPMPGQETQLGRWLELFRPHNPAMGEDGVLEMPLSEGAPAAWLDHLLMIPGWQITQGNYGSKNLLRRVG